jgi:ParB family chromosome partitioning protein
MDASPVMPDTVDEMYDIFLAREAKPLLRDVRVDLIEPNPFQARKEFPGIDELAQAIRAQGFTSRLRVRPHPEVEGKYQLVYGERRLRAAGVAGLGEVPCEIARHSDAEMAEIGLAENIQRRDLTPLEEAQALKALLDQRGYSQRELAERLGKSHGYVQHRLDLLRAPEEVQQLVAQRPDSLKAARNIARVADRAQREELIAAVSEGTITSQEVAERVRELTSAPGLAPSPPPPPTGAASVPGAKDTRSEKHARSALVQILEQESLREDIKFSRWRQALGRASVEERRAFAAYLRERFLPQAAALLRMAEEHDGSKGL